MAKKVKVKLIGSLIGQTDRARATVKGLGLRKLNSVRELEATDAVLGMVKKVHHLVKIIEK